MLINLYDGVWTLSKKHREVTPCWEAMAACPAASLQQQRKMAPNIAATSASQDLLSSCWAELTASRNRPSDLQMPPSIHKALLRRCTSCFEAFMLCCWDPYGENHWKDSDWLAQKARALEDTKRDYAFEKFRAKSHTEDYSGIAVDIEMAAISSRVQCYIIGGLQAHRKASLPLRVAQMSRRVDALSRCVLTLAEGSRPSKAYSMLSCICLSSPLS